MGAINQKRISYGLLLAFVIGLIIWFSLQEMPVAVVVCVSLGFVVLVLLLRENRVFQIAALIRDNPILTVASITVSTNKTKKTCRDETIISTFGLLSDNLVLEWNCAGLRGVRLIAVEIDEARMNLVFGKEKETMRVELLHGLTEEAAVLDVQEKLWRETGVKAKVSNW